MSKYFLYIDESKDFKNNILYFGGYISQKNIHSTEAICQNLTKNLGKKELKSTEKNDRYFFESLDTSIFSEDILSHTCSAKSDKEYLSALLEYIHALLHKHSYIRELHIYADFNRLAPDMSTLEKNFSRKLTHTFDIPLSIEFKNSKTYRCIQFADLVVGTYRRGIRGM